jgi:Zn-dependent protease
MPSLRQGAIHLFRVAGIDVYLHWSWFLVAAFEIQNWHGRYSSGVWSALEYVGLFLIVLLHEFGHALACRQVGGTADRILLWPFGGVAYVNPPQRPGATLWSIAAGPLVNLALLPVLGIPLVLGWRLGWAHTMPDASMLIYWVSIINGGLLVFNVLPIYPLDGGQILRSLLWYGLGRARSLMVATVLGLFGIVGLFIWAVKSESFWIIAISIFMVMNCWGAMRHAQELLRIAKLPRRQGFACPSCRMAPPAGNFWGCGECRKPFDTFETLGACPHCGAQYATTTCLDCGQPHPMSEWIAVAVPGRGVMNDGIPVK